MARLPLTVVARLLSAHKFISTIEKTLNWLRSYVLNPPSVALASDHEGFSEAPLSRESSSSTTVQEMPSIAGKKSKKRKRGQVEPEILTARNAAVLDPVLLYVSICSVLSQVEAPNNRKSEEVENFAIEHIKAAIKASIEQSSEILGSSLEIIAQILRDANSSDPSVTYDVFLKPVLYIWSSRSIFQETTDGLISAVSTDIE